MNIERNACRAPDPQGDGARFSAAFDGMLEGIQILGRDWRYVYLNPAAEFQNRRPKGEFLGRAFGEMWPGVESTGLYACIERCMDERVPSRMENRFYYPDGEAAWFDLSIQPVPEGVLCMSIDTTARKQAESHLEQMKRLYATLSQVNQVIAREESREKLLQSICDVAVRFGEFAVVWIGLLDEATGDIRPRMAHGLDPAEWPFPIANLHAGPFTHGLSATAIRTSNVVTSDDIQADGRTAPLHDNLRHTAFHSLAAVPLLTRGRTIGVLNLASSEVGFFNSEQEVQLLEEVGLDISHALDALETERERKRVEERLQSSEHTLKLFVEFAPAAIAMFDRDMVYLAASHRYCTDYRLAERDLLGRSHYDIFPEIPDRWKEIHRRCLAGAIERAEDDPFPRLDGTLDWIRWEIHPWYEKPGVVGGIILASEVITERKQREKDLRTSEARYRSLVESSSSVIATIDADGRFHYVNRIASEMLGADPADIIGKTMGDLFPPELAGRQLRNICRVIETNEGFIEEAPTVVNGRTRWFFNNIQPIRDPSGRAVLAMLNSQDVTERREAEESIRDSEEKYRLLAENISDVIWILDLETYRFRYVSPSVEQLRGFTAREVIEQDLAAAMTPASLQHLVRVLPGRIEEWNRGITKSYIDEIEQTCKDGKTVWTESRTRGVLNPASGRVEVYGASRDISERKALLAQLVQVQKLESLGTLSSGIAHDFNNILGVIAGHAALLDKPSFDDTMVRKRAHAIAKASARGADLVKQLLTFARKADAQIRQVALDDVVDEVVKLLHETLPKSIEVLDDRERDLPAIEADPSQVHQVLLNLCLNARDAMPEGGTLMISTHSATGESLRPRNPKASAPEYVVMSVTDTGSGMDGETQRRMFEPFFTTKERGKGTGLGLSMVFGIMESHGGIVTVASEPGKGSSFECCFPVTHASPPAVHADEPAEEKMGGGTETVLVVEDEEMIRDMMKMFLESKGYTVLTAEDGEEGFSVYREHAGGIAVVISDLGLPKRNGEKLHRDLKDLHAGVRFILASGYFEPGQKARILEAGVNEIIPKPYDPNDVLRAIHRTLS